MLLELEDSELRKGGVTVIVKFSKCLKRIAEAFFGKEPAQTDEKCIGCIRNKSHP